MSYKPLLDLVITPQSSTHLTVTQVEVCNSFDLSDHELVVCELGVRRHKPPAVHYVYRDIKTLNIAEFETRLRRSVLFTDPATTPDEIVSQFESTVTYILDQLAPMRHGCRPGGRKAARWLSPEAVTAKRLR